MSEPIKETKPISKTIIECAESMRLLMQNLYEKARETELKLAREMNTPDLKTYSEGERRERARILGIITEMETKVTDNTFALDALQSVKALISK